ncbi:helix-turn-helix transcriptional regulator [Anaerostipes hadrus]|nr:helix-turn-helix transcriptional regulator [Anaerostipes hadrus]NSG79698.1 helix-turn-helix transcriptional regulator [Anaerostipes hadrus]NSH08736.1 helix-turn-helix transcriptional regulator [Anaerostipes hadrus]NSH25654.1 helix-turn-helix transcriptional regulator [Anaerostipes hadrus]NSH46762.1 helix-turn-helix transcriptional regulator [Anaerostipes hadrus]
MNTRIKELRKTLKLTQEEFGSRVGVKGNTIGNYELSLRNPSDAIIHSMCREFNVNENWLRSGEGEMFLPVEDEVGEVVSKLVDESNPFYDMIIDIMHTFNNLDDKGQEIICNFTSDLVDRMAKRNKQDN